MKLNAVFSREGAGLSAEPCVVERVMELTGEVYGELRREPLKPYGFIHAHEDVMYRDAEGTMHCLLVIGKGCPDGLLMGEAGDKGTRPCAFLPQARQLLTLARHPSLLGFTRRMEGLVRQWAGKAVEGQQDGTYRIPAEDLPKDLDRSQIRLLAEMLTERPEVGDVEDIGEELVLTLAPGYIRVRPERPRLSQEGAELLCAKHVLWLHGEGGEQADFSGMDLTGLDLKHWNLNRAVFQNARPHETDLREAQLCFSDLTGATLLASDLRGTSVEEAVFEDAVLDGCRLEDAVLTHSSFKGALIRDCQVRQSDWTGCCTEGTEFVDTPMEEAKSGEQEGEETPQPALFI